MNVSSSQSGSVSQPRLEAKIKSLEELAGIVAKHKAEGRVVVHCHGVFDLVHLGHIRHLKAAKREGDVLIVTITPDRFVNKGPGRPVFNEHLRAETLASLEVVDYVAINRWPKGVETIQMLKPSVFVKGDEFVRRETDISGNISCEEDAILAVGGRIHFTSEETFSSSNLLNSYFNVFPPEAERYLAQFRQSHSAGDIIAKLKDLRKLRVLVLGDIIIDEYHFCRAMGKSSKASSINARFLHEESYPGGALAVANHIAGFCDDVHFVSCVGEQNPRTEFVEKHLKQNVTRKLLSRPDGPTTVKRRYTELFQFNKMFEVTFLEDRPLPAQVGRDLNDYLTKVMPNYDALVVADFGHGLIGAETVSLLANSGKFLAINTQTNSANTGYNVITKYPRADYICIDQEEMRLAFHDRFGPLDALVRRAAEQLSASTVAVTTGQSGSVTLRRGGQLVQTPVFSREVVDTVGAGDAYLAVTAPCVAAGWTPELVGFVGNAVGALKIRILGNKESIEPVTLFKYVTTLLK
jgi:rfaE bifunctional protein nucleotidyltransferase chain/domain